METVTLKRDLVGAAHRVCLETLEKMGENHSDTTVNVVFENTTRSLLLSMRRFIYREDVFTKTVSYPATWWQHFKESYFPDWLLRWFPVRYAHRDLRAHCTYPELMLKASLPKELKVYKTVVSEEYH